MNYSHKKKSKNKHPLKEMWGYATILFAIICNYVSFATTYQLHQIWGGFMTIL
jgi:hypothetical protein